MNRQLNTSLTPATLHNRVSPGQTRRIRTVAMFVVAIASCCFILRHASATNAARQSSTNRRVNSNISVSVPSAAPARASLDVLGCVAPPANMVAWYPG